jgi:hypothetical protein
MAIVRTRRTPTVLVLKQAEHRSGDSVAGDRRAQSVAFSGAPSRH